MKKDNGVINPTAERLQSISRLCLVMTICFVTTAFAQSEDQRAENEIYFILRSAIAETLRVAIPDTTGELERIQVMTTSITSLNHKVQELRRSELADSYSGSSARCVRELTT